MIGVAQRRISSTAVGIRARSARSRSSSSGFSISALTPWEMAVLVVSFPAKTRIWKKLQYSGSVRCSPSTSAWTSSVSRSSRGWSRRSLPILPAVLEERVRRGTAERQELERGRVAVRGRIQRLPGRSLDEVVGELDHERSVLLRYPENAHDHVDGKGRRDRRDEVALALGDQPIQQARGDLTCGLLVLRNLAGGEGGADEPAEARVVGRVGLEYRPPGLERVGIQVEEEHVLRRGRVRRRIPGDGDDVLVAGDRPEPLAPVRPVVPVNRSVVSQKPKRLVRQLLLVDRRIGDLDVAQMIKR